MIRILNGKVVSLFSYIYPVFFKTKNNLKVGKKTRFMGLPIIKVGKKNASVVIGKNVLLNSNNQEYFTSISSPVKIQASENGKIEIGDNTRIHGASIHAYKEIKIGKNVLIASGVHIFDTNRHNLAFDDLEKRSEVISKGDPIYIGNYVWIGLNVIILPGVKIGQGSVIGAGSVVTNDIPEMCLAAGNPCRIIKRYHNTELT